MTYVPGAFLSLQVNKKCIRPGMFNLSCGVCTFLNIWSACGQHDIEYTKQVTNK